MDAEDDESVPAQGIYVGEVEGTTAMVGLVRDGAVLSAYVCGREDTLATHTRWFHGALNEDGGTFALQADSWTLSGTFEGDALSGTLDAPDDSSSTVLLEMAAADTLGGLYSVVDSECRAGLIVIDAETAGTLVTQGAWCDGSGLVMQVTPMMPVVLTGEGIQVSVDGADPEHLLTMSPHTP